MKKTTREQAWEALNSFGYFSTVMVRATRNAWTCHCENGDAFILVLDPSEGWIIVG